MQAFRLKKLPSPSSSVAKRWWVRCSSFGLSLLAIGPALSSLAGDSYSDSASIAHVQTAQFKIPFNVESRGGEALKVQLWVSADDGATWQTHGSVAPEAKAFDFRAAAEGTYLFKVATIDAAGTTYPNLGAPLKVLVDTTKPRAELRADIDGGGHLVVDVKVQDEHLEVGSAVLRLRSEQETQWRDLPLELRENGNAMYSGQVIADLPPCRQVAIVFSVKDRSMNEGAATCEYTMPRTAAAPRDVTLASNRDTSGFPGPDSRKFDPPPTATPRLTATPGATRWNPTVTESKTTTPNSPLGIATGSTQAAKANTKRAASPGLLIADGQLSLDPPIEITEELPLPPAMSDGTLTDASGQQLTAKSATEQPPLQPGIGKPSLPETTSLGKRLPEEPAVTARSSTEPTAVREPSTIGRAFHCKSRAFSLDYSVEALGGNSLADVELWGTEDGGREWQKWGSDPDRLSPFDVQVGNDGMFGFRMVIVGSNGIVSNRPREGDAADVWINVDTSLPTVKITRAVYGEGPEDGLLVIDYHCEDGHLVDRPMALSYSERADGPWTEIATGLANTGLYLWKAAPNLPDKIYLKIDGVDKAGNIGTHRLDLPIDIRGLSPRGVIQGFRPIEVPAK